MTTQLATHFWGQSGKAREYKNPIWESPDGLWPPASMPNRFADNRTQYIQSAFAGTQWRVDKTDTEMAVTRFQTLAVPGGTGFVAGTQYFGRNLEPQFGFDGALSKQVEHAANYLEAQISFNPPSLPPSGQLAAFEPEMPNWTKETTEVWIITQVESVEVLEALDILADHPHNNLTAFLSPNQPGHPSHSAWKPLREFSLGELKTELETAKIQRRQAEQDRIQKKKEEEAQKQRELEAEQQKETEAERQRLLPVDQKPKTINLNPPRNGPKPAYFAAGGVLLIIVVAIVAFAIGRGGNSVPPPPPPPPPIEDKSGCMEATALNFDRYATIPTPDSCRTKDNLIAIESIAEGSHVERVYWRNHRYKDESLHIRFNGDPELLSRFQDALIKLTSTSDYNGIQLSARALPPETIELGLSFPAEPKIDQLVIADLGETCGALLSEIRLSILSDNLDIDGDSFLAMDDRYPRFGGQCDGKDSDGDDVDDAIDIDDDDDEVADIDERNGCDDESACNFDPSATENDGSCTYARGACEVCENGKIKNLDADGDGVCDANEVPGCTNRLACNYDSNATDDDGSCNPKDQCGRCDGSDTGPGAVFECGCNDMPEGDCDCDGNKMDALEVCGGGCQEDSDNDGRCDDNGEDNCTDTTAPNYNDPDNTPCETVAPTESDSSYSPEAPAATESNSGNGGETEATLEEGEQGGQPSGEVETQDGAQSGGDTEQPSGTTNGDDNNDDF
jgi:hypothetical protein